MGTLEDLVANLGSDPVERGRRFEHVCKWFIQNDARYAATIEKVWLWSEWPGRWGPDAGIDLVAETVDGSLWAIQAKAYAPTSTVTKRDVDSFLSESARAEFSYRLLIATTDRLSHNAARAMDSQEKPVGRILLSGLQRSDLRWPDTPDQLLPDRRPKPLPRPHQLEAIAAVVDGFNRGAERGQMLMACGTGKTLTALWIADALEAQRTLVLVPSLSLLAQTMREWATQSTDTLTFLPVCSDDTVRGVDSLVASTSELGIPTTTSPAEIARFLRGSGRRVVFSTYQSSNQIAEAMTLDEVPVFDLVVADEAHRCAGRVDARFSTVLDAGQIPSARRLFMTATPRYFTERVRQDASSTGDHVASMDDEDVFGSVLYALSFGEAIQRDLLTDYRVAVVVATGEEHRDSAERGVLVEPTGLAETDARTLAAQVSLIKAMDQYDLRRTISFHSRVAGARAFSRSLRSVSDWMGAACEPVGELVADYVSGDMPSGQRDMKLNRLRSIGNEDRMLLSNARCLAEGVDVPTLDGVAFVDPRRSQVDIVQAVGRAIRRSPDKAVGTILLPVFIDPDGDAVATLESSAFKPVWSVLRALTAHDDPLAESLDDSRRELGRRGGAVRLPSKIVVDLPTEIDEGFAAAFNLRLVEQASSAWEFGFGMLQRYVDVHGCSLVPQWYEVDGFRLGLWASNQRARRRVLSDRRVALLEGLPDWAWHLRSQKWSRAYALLTEFARREGHSRVPQPYVEGSFPLGTWVNTQRTLYRSGTLLPDRVAKLEALPGWNWEPLSDRWADNYDALREYLRETQRTEIPARLEVDGLKLGVWVGSQRNRYVWRVLSGDRVRALEALPNWEWRARAEWDVQFDAFERYVRAGGSMRPGRSVVREGLKIGEWVAKQKGLYRSDEMPSERIERFESLPNWSWDPVADAWEASYEALEVFAREEGHARPARTVVFSGEAIGQWVASQRTSQQQGRLSTDRAQRLEALAGWAWSVSAWKWEAGFQALTEFVDEHGHARVPHNHKSPEGFSLGTWVLRQRSLRRSSRLPRDRIDRLEAFPGWTWDPANEQWDSVFLALREHVRATGSLPLARSVVVEGIQLARWVEVQRRNHRAGALSSSRANRLEEIPEWTWDTAKE